jgi:hypothetical protein
MDVARGRRSERVLVGVSLAQLACGSSGAAVAIRRGHAYDVGFTKGAPERVMASGYLAERLVRHRLGRHGWEPVESPMVAAGVGLSIGMFLSGRRLGARGP